MSDSVRSSTDELRQWEAVVAASRLAEDAESDESALLALWRDHRRGEPSPLLSALSSAEQRAE